MFSRLLAPLKLDKPRKCSCGQIHVVIPGDARVLLNDDLAGACWECSCSSTMFIPASVLATLEEAD